MSFEHLSWQGFPMSEHASTQSQAQPLPIRFNLVLPVTRVGVGLFSFDPLEQWLGRPLEHILQPAMVGPVHQRSSPQGPAVNVYPLAIPSGEGISISLGQFGELGFFAWMGQLRLCVPLTTVGWVQERLAHVIVQGPEVGLSSDQRTHVAYVWLRLLPGMRLGIPVPGLGELGVEAG